MQHAAPFLIIGGVLLITLFCKAIFRADKISPVESRFLKGRWYHLPTGSLAKFVSGAAFPFLVALAVLLLWIIWSLNASVFVEHNFFRPFFVAAGIFLLTQMLVSSFCQPVRSKDTDGVETYVIIPAYNENEESLKNCLRSCLVQTELPTGICVIDDCSTVSDYNWTREWFINEAEKKGVVAIWRRLNTNGGKRQAQAAAVSVLEQAGINVGESIVITTDSDGVLDPKAIEEGLKPFSDDEVMAVGGLMISKNYNSNLLTRICDIIFVTQQLIGRGSLSVCNSVIVNSGAIAFYRGEVITRAIDKGYCSESFMGREVRASDDSYLTMCALLSGKTVFQPSSIALADMPSKFGHHIRQQLRWERGSTMRGLWRLKYLPVFSVGFFRQLLGWMIYWVITAIVAIVSVGFIINGQWSELGLMFVVGLILAVAYFSRYFHVLRKDEGFGSRIVSLLLMPFAFLWFMTVLKFVRVYATGTCRKISSWGTRDRVEKL